MSDKTESGARELPTPPIPHKEDIPQELQAFPQFVAWCYEWRIGEKSEDQKLTKVPYTTQNNQASHSRPRDWTTLDKVLGHIDANPARKYGVGYVFSENDPFCGIDLDNCRDPKTGEIAEWAWEWIRKLGSYAEVSPSGTGVKVVVKAVLPGKGRKNPNYEGGAVEVYDRKRFFTLTGVPVE